jgi:hypothetical protein
MRMLLASALAGLVFLLVHAAYGLLKRTAVQAQTLAIREVRSAANTLIHLGRCDVENPVRILTRQMSFRKARLVIFDPN